MALAEIIYRVGLIFSLIFRLGVPVEMEAKTGMVRVSDNLQLAASSSPLRLLVGVVDGGSPQRYALASLTVYIRDIPGVCACITYMLYNEG